MEDTVKEMFEGITDKAREEWKKAFECVAEECSGAESILSLAKKKIKTPKGMMAYAVILHVFAEGSHPTFPALYKEAANSLNQRLFAEADQETHRKAQKAWMEELLRDMEPEGSA